MIPALFVGTVLALAALAYVLYPLFFAVAAPPAATPSKDGGDSAVVALREVEFDRATGKLSDADYALLKDRYTRQALVEMRENDPVEAAVRLYRQTHGDCVTCGPRPEPDARFCSNCGGFLAGACPGCGAKVTVAGSRHCSDCGTRLAA